MKDSLSNQTQRSFVGKAPGADVVLLSVLSLFDLLLVLVALTAYRISFKPSFLSFLQSLTGYLFAAALLGVVVSVITLIWRYYQDDRVKGGAFKMTVAMHTVTVLMLFAVGEGTIRALYKETPTGDMLGGTYLYPREWGKVVSHFRAMFQSHLGKVPFHVYDDLLGWTIASSRRSEEGLYFSSAEGLRSQEVGTVLADQPGTTRIALLGDSYTFSEEVSFDESWGRQLELRLGKNFQVLNFGVMGYSIAQAYLRYVKEVRPWHPEVVIFGFIDDNLRRAMGVYSFLTFPQGSSPFATPRFVMTAGQLTLLNTPLPSPEQIFSAKSVNDLPNIEYDLSYVPSEWDRPYWTIPTWFYLFRWLESWFPFFYPTPSPEVSGVAMRAISLEIFRAFTEKVRADGSIPLLVYLPSWGKESNQAGYDPLAVQILRTAGLEYIDLTECLAQVPFADRLMPRHHYSPKGNEAAAVCLRKVITEHLRKG